MKTELKHPYVSVAYGRGESYGGSQSLLGDKTERAVGCGVVAGLDLLAYLSRWHGDTARLLREAALPEDGAIPAETYIRLAHRLRKAYLPLIPGQGINGILLALGLDRVFLGDGLPYLARWGVPYRRLWSETERMLAEDIPVILSVGPNFPKLWQHRALRLYDGADGRASGETVHAHYLTVTGMDGEWLQAASWGRRCFIRREEYLAYVAAHSARLLSNILTVRRIRDS